MNDIKAWILQDVNATVQKSAIKISYIAKDIKGLDFDFPVDVIFIQRIDTEKTILYKKYKQALTTIEQLKVKIKELKK